MSLLEGSKIVFSFVSPYQSIEVFSTKDGKYGLLLDGELQYIEGLMLDEYHSKLSKGINFVPAKNVAILGGGDGILASYIYSKNPNVNIYMFELDPYVVHIHRTFLRRVNNNIFNKGVVRLVFGDAYENIAKRKWFGFFDIVFQDFPDYSEKTKQLYSENMVKRIKRILKRGGVFSMYSGGFVEPPPHYCKHFSVLSISEVIVPNIGLFGSIFHFRRV